MNPNDASGPAFPTPIDYYASGGSLVPGAKPGLTRREYYAIEMAKALIASGAAEFDPKKDADYVVQTALRLAGLMIKRGDRP